MTTCKTTVLHSTMNNNETMRSDSLAWCAEQDKIRRLVCWKCTNTSAI